MKQVDKRVELLHEAQHTLAEGPLWDYKNNTQYWVDILEKRVCGLKMEGGEYFEYTLDKEIGTIALTSTSELLLAMSDGVYFFNPKLNSLRFIEGSKPPDSDQRYNDGKCDAAGRLIAGTTSLSGRPKQGFLFQMEYNGNELIRKTLLEGVSISNGLCWNDDNTVMYYIDSPTGEISAFEYRLSDGSLGNKKIFARISPEEGVPDGMTIDQQERLYIAHWGGAKISVWNTENGERVDELSVPAPHVTSCTFGGEDLSELIISSARTGISQEQLENNSLSGSLFRYRSSTRGRRANVFKVPES